MVGKFPTSVIELSQTALRKNITFLRTYLPEGCEFCSVIKGNAYGHGIATYLPMVEKCGVKTFAVFNADEAWVAWNSARKSSHIIIMGDLEGVALEWAIENGLAMFVFNLERLKDAARIAHRMGKRARVHLELETGLNRTGLRKEELLLCKRFLDDHPDDIRIEGVCTHYAGAESIANYLRVQNQMVLFGELCGYLDEMGVSYGSKHTACSAAAIRYPATVMDMVRFGIAQYGFWPTREVRMDYVLKETDAGHDSSHDPLKRILTWKSRIMSIKDVNLGQFVGYGNSYLTTRRQRIATIPVGYFHGFTRQLSNLGHVLIQGRRCPVVGVVNMNLMQVDVTDTREAAIGDEVVILGKQRKAEISVGSFSDLTRVLNYEVLVRIPSEIPRVVVR